MKPISFALRLLATLCLFGAGLSARAQWVTQAFELRTGWNAVYLHVDASHDSIENLVGPGTLTPRPIEEIWLWLPNPATLQFVTSPQEPLERGSRWVNWRRAASGLAQPLQRLVGNAAYLVLASTNATWEVKGRPVPPNYQWTTSGLNLFGFPTVRTNPPSLEAFLGQAAELQQSAELYRYPGGPLGATNPARVFAFRTTPVQRGEAFWVRAGDLYNRYYGPFELVSPGPNGVDFRDNLSTSSLRLRNLTATNLTVTLECAASETPPAGQPALAGTPPLLVRGNLNPTNLTYGYRSLPVGGSQSWVLKAAGQPGSEVEVVLGLNRAAMTSTPGDLVAGRLRFTDSLGHTLVEVPVSATTASNAGLWVGGAMATQVGQYLKSYQRDATDQLISDTNGQYVVTGVNTNLGAVPRFFPLRLIVHNPTNTGGAVLLQHVFVGLDPFTNQVVATRESLLGRRFLTEARRISASHLPWSATNAGWTFNGKLGLATTVTVEVVHEYTDHASNPFVHTYHPDHDNLDATFRNVLPQGAESYTIVRDITLEVTPPADDFTSLTDAGQTLGGRYAETIRLLGLARGGGTYDTREFQVRGAFTLNRLNALPILTIHP